MKLFLVRHAHAGSRRAWTGDDRLRPLSQKGRLQAAAVAGTLREAGLTHLVSSPSVRCIETLRPLAEQISLPIDDDARLAEGSDAEAALALAEELRRDGSPAAALCSHGDVIPDLLLRLKADGTMFHDPLTWPKGSVWVVDGDGDEWRDAAYVASLSPR